MNPFAVSFPGDIEIPWNYNQSTTFASEDRHEDGSIPGPQQHAMTSMHDAHAVWGNSQAPSSAAAMPRQLSTFPGGVRHNVTHQQRGSSTSSPHLTVTHPSQGPMKTVNRPSTSPLINVTLPSPSPTSTTPRQTPPNYGTPTSVPSTHYSGTISATALAPSSSSKPGQPDTPSSSTTGGGFQFVDASDRKTIVRLRNTMVSRKHRDNKVQRIKELERMLEERDKEIEELRRAVAEGSKGKEKRR